MEDASARLVVWILLALHVALILSFIWLNSRRIWWRNSLRALKNPSRGQVLTEVAPDGSATFSVTPARGSRLGALVFFVALVLLVWSFERAAVLIFFLSLTSALIGVLGFAAGGRYRQPTRIEVARKGLVAGGVSLPLGKILSFGVDQSPGIGFTLAPASSYAVAAVHRDAPVVGWLPEPIRVRLAMLDRAYLVTVLSTNGGGSILAGGLDAATARDLAQDLNRRLTSLRR